MGKTYQSIVVDAPVEKVWGVLRNFHDASWAPNVVTNLEVVGDAGATDIGAKRVLNGVFSETLRSLDDEERVFTYSIDEGPPPVSSSDVSNYVGRVEARAVTQGGGTFVEWSSSWEMNDEAAAEFCQGIYVALLGELKTSME